MGRGSFYLVILLCCVLQDLRAESAQPQTDFQSAYAILSEHDSALVEDLDAEELRLLKVLSYEQLVAWSEGADPKTIILPGGDSLAKLLGSGYQVLSWTIDGGGGDLTGDGYALTGSIGQPDAGTMRGGDYSLGGGFLGEPLPEGLFADGFEPDTTARR